MLVFHTSPPDGSAPLNLSVATGAPGKSIRTYPTPRPAWTRAVRTSPTCGGRSGSRALRAHAHSSRSGFMPTAITARGLPATPFTLPAACRLAWLLFQAEDKRPAQERALWKRLQPHRVGADASAGASGDCDDPPAPRGPVGRMAQRLSRQLHRGATELRRRAPAGLGGSQSHLDFSLVHGSHRRPY